MAFKNHAFRHECRQRATCLFVISWVWFDPVRPGGVAREQFVNFYSFKLKIKFLLQKKWNEVHRVCVITRS